MLLEPLFKDIFWMDKEGSLFWWNHFCKWFLNYHKFTVLSIVFWSIVGFFWHLHLLGKVLGIWAVEKLSVSSLTKPVITSFQLIWNVCVVILERIFRDICISICAFASKGEICTSVLVSWLNILIIAFISWEMWRVSA